MRVTVKSLRKLRACEDQVALFAAEWPDGVEVSEAVLLRAAEIGLDLDWWAQRVLSPPLLAEYERQRAPLWAEYERQCAPLGAEYERQCAPLWAEYERQCAPLLWRLMAEEDPRGGKA